MKFIALVEYDYPVEHKPPVKAELVLHGDRVDGKIIEIGEHGFGAWVGIDEEPHEDYECNVCGFVVSTWTANIKPQEVYKYCPHCGAYMINGGDAE